MIKTDGIGQFAIDCWRSAEPVGEPYCEFSDDLAALQSNAKRYIAAGRFKFIRLCRRSTDTSGPWVDDEGWDVIDSTHPAKAADI